MTWLTPKLNKRIKLLKAVQTPAVNGGMERGYEVITRLWSGVQEVKGGQYIRGVQIDKGITHLFTIRTSGINSLGKTFAFGFGKGLDTIGDRRPVKTEYFVFLNYGSQIITCFSNAFSIDFDKFNTYQGSLFRIKTVKNNKEQNEYLLLNCNEIEEQNTGFKI